MNWISVCDKVTVNTDLEADESVACDTTSRKRVILTLPCYYALQWKL